MIVDSLSLKRARKVGRYSIWLKKKHGGKKGEKLTKRGGGTITRVLPLNKHA